jgi:hypothetical protein
MGLLRRLPDSALRRNGFGLAYGVNVRTSNEALVDIEEGRRGVIVEKDGSFASSVAANTGFLGWGSQQSNPPPSLASNGIRLNPYVLAEYSLEFARFVRGHLMEELGREGWTLAIVARNLQTGNPIPYYPSNPTQIGHQAYRAILDSASETFPATGEAEHDGYELLRHLLEWFGVPAKGISFVDDERITAETIRSWR